MDKFQRLEIAEVDPLVKCGDGRWGDCGGIPEAEQLQFEVSERVETWELRQVYRTQVIAP